MFLLYIFSVQYYLYAACLSPTIPLNPLLNIHPYFSDQDLVPEPSHQVEAQVYQQPGDPGPAALPADGVTTRLPPPPPRGGRGSPQTPQRPPVCVWPPYRGAGGRAEPLRLPPVSSQTLPTIRARTLLAQNVIFYLLLLIMSSLFIYYAVFQMQLLQ